MKTLYNFDENKKTVYHHIVDLDERGMYHAHVENSTGKVIFSFSNENIMWDEDTEEEYTEYGEISLVFDGYMKNIEDMRGLKNYLVEAGIMKNNWYLKDDEHPNRPFC